jgi:hypothetical protein
MIPINSVANLVGGDILPSDSPQGHRHIMFVAPNSLYSRADLCVLALGFGAVEAIGYDVLEYTK